MSILLADNFSYLGRKPLDGRIVVETIADMATIPDSSLYSGLISYNLEDKQYYNYDADNELDPTLGKWRLFTLGGLGNAFIEEYAKGQEYTKDTLIVVDGQLYIVTEDFISNDTEPTLEGAFNKDLEAGNIIPITQDMTGFMPEAPKTYTYTIENAGTGYAVNDIVRTTSTYVFVEVSQVDDDGAILQLNPVETTNDTVPSTEGTGAKIIATEELYVGTGNEWRAFPTIEGTGGDAALTEDIVSNVAVGGAPEGTRFVKDTTFTEAMKMLLLKTIIPTITFSATGSGLHEVGETVNGSTLKVTITNLPKVTTTMNTIEFKVGNTVVDTQDFVEGQDTYTYVTSDLITTNTTISVVFTYDDIKKLESKATFNFVKASYYGSVTDLEPDEDTILGLTKVVKDTKAFTWENAVLNDSRFCYAYPTSFGNLTSIKDANNFEYINSYTKLSDTIDGTQYNIYVLTDPVTITGAKQIYA